MPADILRAWIRVWISPASTVDPFQRPRLAADFSSAAAMASSRTAARRTEKEGKGKDGRECKRASAAAAEHARKWSEGGHAVRRWRELAGQLSPEQQHNSSARRK